MTENKGSNRRKSPGMESDTAFGKWCKEQEFGVNRPALFKYRTAWQEFTRSHENGEKLTDYNSWSAISGLNHLQKPRVLERLALWLEHLERLHATQARTPEEARAKQQALGLMEQSYPR